MKSLIIKFVGYFEAIIWYFSLGLYIPRLEDELKNKWGIK